MGSTIRTIRGTAPMDSTATLRPMPTDSKVRSAQRSTHATPGCSSTATTPESSTTSTASCSASTSRQVRIESKCVRPVRRGDEARGRDDAPPVAAGAIIRSQAWCHLPCFSTAASMTVPPSETAKWHRPRSITVFGSSLRYPAQSSSNAYVKYRVVRSG